MPQGPDEEQLRHAEQVRAATQGRRDDAQSTPEERIERLIDAKVAKAVADAVAKLKITGTQGIIITGSAGKWTIGQQPVTGSAVGTCNDDGTGMNFVFTLT